MRLNSPIDSIQGAFRTEILSVTGLLLAIALAILALYQIRILAPRSAARAVVMLLIATATALIAFAWWGQYAAAGRRAFDEMDGLYPFAAGVIGVLLTLLRHWPPGGRRAPAGRGNRDFAWRLILPDQADR